MQFTPARCNVRKTLCGNTLLAVALAFMVSGCGAGPTAPGTTPSGQAAIVTPPPAPTPAPPTPEPTPGPVPAPVPPPSPSPPSWTFDGSTSQAHWHGQPVLPDHFEVQIADGSVQAAGHGFPIQSQAPGNVYVIAGTRN